MKETLQEGVYIEKILKPENDLEKSLLEIAVFKKGLFWGKPRYGHPEGKVLYHIREVLDNIDKITLDSCTRNKLRLIAFSHDTFKYQEVKTDPMKHHAMLARKFMEDFTNDIAVLDTIELHDEAYYSWRSKIMFNEIEEGTNRLKALLNRIQDNIQLYYLFFKCDTRTGDKTQSPLYWFEKNIEGIELVKF